MPVPFFQGLPKKSTVVSKAPQKGRQVDELGLGERLVDLVSVPREDPVERRDCVNMASSPVNTRNPARRNRAGHFDV